VWSLRRLNALLNRVVLCEAVTAITDLLMEDGPSKDNFLRSEWRGVRGRGGGDVTVKAQQKQKQRLLDECVVLLGIRVCWVHLVLKATSTWQAVDGSALHGG
jgi:hypothetical protein